MKNYARPIRRPYSGILSEKSPDIVSYLYTLQV